MARIAGASAADMHEDVALALQYTRSGLTTLTGRETEHMLEPLEIYALLPDLLRGIGALEQATGQLTGLDKRHRALALLKAATLTNCEYCIDLGSQISRQWGLTDQELLALPSYRSSLLFSELDKLVLEYAVAVSRTPVDVSDDLFARLQSHLDDKQLVELTHLIALENMRGRFNLALGIGSSGFTEGMVCAVPESVPQMVG